MEEARRALETMRDLAPRVGVGTNVVQTAITFVERGDADVVMLAGRYTLLDRSAAEELLPLCAERGVELLAAGVFNSGVLAGGTMFDYEAAAPAVLELRRRLEEACALHAVPLAAAALQFPLRHPAVSSILVGARDPEEIAENIRLIDHPVPEELWSELASIR
jgi:D-threo-aldose 1-dehydrogenase